MANANDLFGDIAAIMQPEAPAATNSNKRVRRDAQGNILPDAKLWLDIGLPFTYVDPDSGEQVTEIVSLPVNLAIDTMKKRELPKRAPNTARGKLYLKRLLIANKLHDILMKLADANIPAEGGVYALDGLPLKMQLSRLAPESSDAELEGAVDSDIMAEIDKAFGL